MTPSGRVTKVTKSWLKLLKKSGVDVAIGLQRADKRSKGKVQLDVPHSDLNNE